MRIGAIIAISVAGGVGADILWSVGRVEAEAPRAEKVSPRSKPAVPRVVANSEQPGPIKPTGSKVNGSTVLGNGQAVQVEWKGLWWRGEVLARIGDGRVAIHYTGWGNEWDEIVARSRLRLAGAVVPVAWRPGPVAKLGAQVTEETRLRVGQLVQIEWNGDWWQGEIAAIKGDGGVRIHYVGWEDSWDETVTRARLRLQDGGI